MHDARSQHRNYPPEWDRPHRTGVAGTGANNHASRSAAGGRSSGGAGRNSRASSSRQPSNSRAAGHGYADGVILAGVGPNNSGGGNAVNVGGSVGGTALLTAVPGMTSSAVGAGVVSRAQMPLPALPSTAQTQQQAQQQLPQQAYYAPKGV